MPGREPAYEVAERSTGPVPLVINVTVMTTVTGALGVVRITVVSGMVGVLGVIGIAVVAATMLSCAMVHIVPPNLLREVFLASRA
jgi:hypothetical protein